MASHHVTPGSHSHPYFGANPEDDESEWEYEYSTTETETFYVTLDLSKADFTTRDPATINTAGGLGSYETSKETEGSLTRPQGVGNARANSPGDSDGENGDGDDGEGRPQTSQSHKPSSKKDSQESREGEDAHRVQILELHSPNPVISYKGRVYVGQWCQNVGTELLLTQRDSSPSSDLPALRYLENDVALLAASSARINVHEQELKPKDSSANNNSNNNVANEGGPSHGPADLVPPPDRGATQERYQQGRFLADLIALKKRKGETDEVTVIAKNVHRKKAQKVDDAAANAGKVHRPKGRPPRAERQQYTPGSSRLTTRRGGAGKGAGMGRRRGRGRGGALHALREISLGAESIGSSIEPSLVSTPTPGHWDAPGEEDGPTPSRGSRAEGDDGEEGEEDDDDEYGSGSGGEDNDDDDGSDEEEEAPGDMDVDED
ncbi:hypothetical protein F4810DRAFT_672573 [Camillea tinctor]|nr:hypothetical protein F4810DRAFT_672573 [Camillea tinctor]